MDLFSVVHLAKPKLVTVGVRPLREGEAPILETTAGRTMEFTQSEPEDVPLVVLAPTPLRSVPSTNVPPPEMELLSTDSSESIGIIRTRNETDESSSMMKRKRTSGSDGAGSSKRRRHIIFGDDVSSEDQSIDVSPASVAKDATQTPPPK